MALQSTLAGLRDLLAAGFLRFDMQSGFTTLPDGTTLTDRQLASPATGATVQMTDNSKDGILQLTPAGTIAALTLTLPAEANTRLGQVRRIFSSQNVTALTIQGATTIYNNVTTMAAGDCIAFVKVGPNMWARQK